MELTKKQERCLTLITVCVVVSTVLEVAYTGIAVFIQWLVRMHLSTPV